MIFATVAALLAFLARALGNAHGSLDTVVDSLADELTNKVSRMSLIQSSSLDNMTLAKVGQLRTSRTSGNGFGAGGMQIGARRSAAIRPGGVCRAKAFGPHGEMAATGWSAGTNRAVGWQSRLAAESGRHGTAVHAATHGSFVVNLPASENELLAQVYAAVATALSDGQCLLEIEIPLTSGVGMRSGDSCSIADFNANQLLMRKLLEFWEGLGTAESVRVVFPNAKEMQVALEGCSTDPVSGQFEQDPTFDTWGGEVEHLEADDLLSQQPRQASIDLIGYPYDDSGDLMKVMSLWQKRSRPTVLFNPNLDVLRAGWYPFGDEKKLQKDLVPQVETAYYLHQFKGASPGWLLRVYPGPWRVIRAKREGGFECLEETEARPKLQDVARKFFSGAGGAKSAATDVGSGEQKPLKSYYDTLGVGREATGLAIKEAYREQSKKLHPEAGGDPMLFHELSTAFAVLKDSRTRKLYDKHGERWIEEEASYQKANR